MKKILFALIITGLAISGSVTLSSCNRKSGCPAYDSLKAPVTRKGELSNKRGSSALFPKDLNKGKKKKK